VGFILIDQGTRLWDLFSGPYMESRTLKGGA